MSPFKLGPIMCMLKKLLYSIKYKTNIHFLLLIASCFLLVGTIALLARGTFGLWDARFNDSLFRLRYYLTGKQKIDPAIVHLDLIDRDIENLDISLWDRTIYARIITILKKAQARMIVFDVIFQDKTFDNNDRALIEAMNAADNVYLPLALSLHSDSGSKNTVNKTISRELLTRCFIRPTILKEGKPYHGGIIIHSFHELLRSKPGSGHVNGPTDNDGILRRYPLLIAHDDQHTGFYPALGFRMIRDYFEVRDEDITVEFGKHLTIQNISTGGQRIIPIDEEGRMIINWAGPWEDSFPHYSFESILRAQYDARLMQKLTGVMQGKIVIISDVSSRSSDSSIGVFNRLFPSCGIHSNVVNTIMTDNFLYTPGFMYNMLTPVILGLLLYWSAGHRKAHVFFLYSFGILMLFFIIIIVLFIYANLLANITWLIISYILAVTLICNYRPYRREQEKIMMSKRAVEDRADTIFSHGVNRSSYGNKKM